MQDMTATISDFEQQIMQEGLNEGIQKGRQEGRQEGLNEGLNEGMREKAREFARLMLGDGKPEWEVRRYTDLSSEEIRQIKSEIQDSGH